MPGSTSDHEAMRPSSLRLANAALAMEYLADGESLSRAELARRTSLSPQALGAILADLVESGLLVEQVRETSSPGRPPTEYRVVPSGSFTATVMIRVADYFVMIDDALRTRVVTQRVRYQREDTAQSLIQSIATTLDRAATDLGFDLDRLRHVEFAVQGTIGEHQRVIGTTVAWGEQHVDVVSRLEQALGRDVAITVTGIEQAQSNHALAVVEPESNELVAILHIGLESRLVLACGGELMGNKVSDGGVLTHLPVIGNDRVCDCGKIGCLGTVSGGNAVLVHYREVTGTSLASAGDLVDLVGNGDPDAIEAARRSIDWLVSAIAPILEMIRPDRIVFTGGGVGRPDSPGAKRLVESVREAMGSTMAERPMHVVAPAFVTDLNAL